ncbi:hypothetical protein QCA50_012602 [Cerrena zonata]|uniref:CxC5 like cysteine cluster associated with KDZ domain-containing protein n=1 Tax=Cerrena zonata TaxID=2478898 RepID=A0AAW0FRK9_9APHY
MLLSTFVDIIGVHPTLSKLQINDIHQFIAIARLLKVHLSHQQPHYLTTPPTRLPANIHEFLQCCMSLSDETLKIAWEALKTLIWEEDTSDKETSLKKMYLPLFLRFGLSRNISFIPLYPPIRTCLECRLHNTSQNSDHILGEGRSHPITIFTQECGPIPGYTHSLYCRKCNTRYHPDYYVHSKATRRTYYGTSLAYLQIATHYYIDRKLAELFTSMMVNAWTSATNCARIYNESLIASSSITDVLPPAWEYRLHMKVEDVWNTFFLQALLLDTEEHANLLELPHDASSQAARLEEAIQSRNALMSGTGQEHWNHACDLCCWVHTDAMGTPGYLRSVVVDGISIAFTIAQPPCHPCKTDSALLIKIMTEFALLPIANTPLAQVL